MYAIDGRTARETKHKVEETGSHVEDSAHTPSVARVKECTVTFPF